MRNANVRGESSLQITKRWALTLVVGVSLLGILPSVASAGAVVPGFDGTVFPRNDDGSVGPVALGFTVNYFGEPASTAFVNNNGNITLDGAFQSFTPFLLATTNPPRRLIAPFFSDVDTRTFGDPVAYGSGTFAGRQAFGVSWRNVYFFGGRAAAAALGRNTFQLILVQRNDVGAGDFDIVFNYDQIQWEAGTSSGGNANGLGGSSARAGYTTGTGEPGTFFELPGGGVPGTFIDGGTAPLIDGTFNSAGVLGRYTFAVRNGIVLPPTGFDCGSLMEIVGVWGLSAGRCGNFVSNATTARYESAMYEFAPPVLRGSVAGEYVYEVELVANRPRQPSAAASVLVSGSPLPLQTTTRNWNRAIAFNISHNGRYSIFSYNGPGLPVALQRWVTPVGVAINRAPLSNILTVERVQDNTNLYRLLFSINGVLVRDLPDTYGVDQFGVGFVRSVPSSGNLVTDDWLEVLDVSLSNPVPTATRQLDQQVSRAQRAANDAANVQRGNDDPLFAPR